MLRQGAIFLNRNRGAAELKISKHQGRNIRVLLHTVWVKYTEFDRTAHVDMSIPALRHGIPRQAAFLQSVGLIIGVYSQDHRIGTIRKPDPGYRAFLHDPYMPRLIFLDLIDDILWQSVFLTEYLLRL